MTVTVQGPGFSVDFPDGTDDATINRQMSLANHQMKAAGDPGAKGDVTVGSVARGLFKGLPFIGEYRDEMAAKARSLVGQDYDQSLALERGRDQAFEEAHPYLSTGLGVAGGVYGTVAGGGLLRGAGAASTVGRTLLGLGAKTLPGAIGRGAVAGALQGAAAGAGAAEGDIVDRGLGAVTGGALGGTIGAAAPAVVEGVRRPAAAAYNRMFGDGDALSQLAGGARGYVGQISSPESVNRIEQGLARLGPDAMLADVSPEWNMVARGAAARPGSRETVVQPLEARNAASNVRLGTDLDASLGPAQVPSRIEAGITEQARGVGPQYDAAQAAAKAVPTEPLAQRLEAMAVNLRGEPRQAVQDARGWLNIPGTDQLDPHPAAIHQVREAIDGRIASTTDPQVRRQLTMARQEVDQLLERSVPGIKEADAQYAELMRQREAVARGQTLLDTGREAIRPQELADQLTAAAQPTGRMVGPSAEALRLRQGLRADIDRLAGTNGNDALALRRTIRGSEEDGDWNPQKLGQIFGEDRAAQALGAIDRETTFQGTRNRVVGGSDTAATKGFNEFLDRVENPLSGGGKMDATAAGVLLDTAGRIKTMMIGAVGQARANRFAGELGAMAVAQGATRDEFVAAMKRAGMNRAQVERALRIATSGGLIFSREAPEIRARLQK